MLTYYLLVDNQIFDSYYLALQEEVRNDQTSYALVQAQERRAQLGLASQHEAEIFAKGLYISTPTNSIYEKGSQAQKDALNESLKNINVYVHKRSQNTDKTSLQIWKIAAANSNYAQR